MFENKQRYLYSLKQGDKFIYNNKIHTVFSHEGNMSEIFVNGEWKAWPNYNGKESIKVTIYHPPFK